MTSNTIQIPAEKSVSAESTTTTPITTQTPEISKDIQKGNGALVEPISQPASSAITVALQSILPPPASSLRLPDSTSISSLRISTHYGDRMGVKKVLVNVPVGKPNKSSFFRIRDGEQWEFTAYIYEDKLHGCSYVLTQEMASTVFECVRLVKLHTGIDRQGNPMLIPLPLPTSGDEGKYSPWHASFEQALLHAKRKWVRVAANMAAGSYDVHEAQADLGDPEWGEHTMEQLIEIAFRGKIVSSVEHTLIQELQGRV